jgi:hypothetical protein
MTGGVFADNAKFARLASQTNQCRIQPCLWLVQSRVHTYTQYWIQSLLSRQDGNRNAFFRTWMTAHRSLRATRALPDETTLPLFVWGFFRDKLAKEIIIRFDFSLFCYFWSSIIQRYRVITLSLCLKHQHYASYVAQLRSAELSMILSTKLE